MFKIITIAVIIVSVLLVVFLNKEKKIENPMFSYKPEDVYSNPQSIALARAIQNNIQKDVTEILNAKDLNVSDRGEKGLSLIVWAASHGNMSAVRSLIAKGAAVDDTFTTGEGFTYNLVSLATGSKDEEFLHILLEAGANPNGVSGTEAPLFTALHGKKWDRFDLLIQKGADINKTDDAGVSVLMELAYVREYAQVLKLLQMGANPDQVSNVGMSLMSIIEKYPLDPTSDKGKEQKKVIEYLKK